MVERARVETCRIAVKLFYSLMVFGFLAAAGSGFSQTSVPSSGVGSTNAFSVSLWLPHPGEPFHAPATIRLFARIRSGTAAQKGDVPQVQFFANASLLGSATAVWHEGMKPNPNSSRPQPMIVRLPGYSPAMFVWSNAPAGTYTLTAQATGPGGVKAVSPPANLTIVP